MMRPESSTQAISVPTVKFPLNTYGAPATIVAIIMMLENSAP